MFDSKNFSVMSYANGFTLWNYATPDTLAQVKSAGYFNETAPFARCGDMILVNASSAGTLESAIMSVAANAGGVVIVSAIASTTPAQAPETPAQ